MSQDLPIIITLIVMMPAAVGAAFLGTVWGRHTSALCERCEGMHTPAQGCVTWH